MCFTDAIVQRGKTSWKRTIESAASTLVLSAVAVAGLVLFGSEVSALWKAPMDDEQAPASGGAFAGLWNFAAPAETAARFEAGTKAYEKGMFQEVNASLLAENWKFTQISISAAAFLIAKELEELESFASSDNVSTFDSAVGGINIQNLITAVNDLLGTAPGGAAQLLTTAYLQQLSSALYQQATNLEGLGNSLLNSLNVLGQGLSSSFPSLSPLINSYFNTLQNLVSSLVTSQVQIAQALQNLINAQIPAPLRPPPIPSASPHI